MKFNKHILTVMVGCAALLPLGSCLSDGDSTVIISDTENPLGIPSDSQAGANPDIYDYDVDKYINLPGSSTEVDLENGWAYVKLSMNGIWDDTTGEWLRLYGTGHKKQNTWLSIDGEPKGIDIYNNADDSGRELLTDIVFLVDNSGSMSEESNELARSIIEWTQQLTSSGLNVRVGCVGYGEGYHAINGALNLTTPKAFKSYLDNESTRYRTAVFDGPDGDILEELATGGRYENGISNECGMVAFHFANECFTFRKGANRVYVNFTDEPNQPNGKEKWSVEWLNPNNKNWEPAMGTIHTVYSESGRYQEYPWLMSDYTGGTTIFANPSFSNVTLSDLPVTGALMNSYIIRFTNIEKYMDGRVHRLKITVLTSDGHIAGEQTLNVVFN